MENNNEKQMMYSSNDDGSKIVIDGENNIHSPSQFSRFGANIIPHQNDQKRPTTATRFKYSSHASYRYYYFTKITLNMYIYIYNTFVCIFISNIYKIIYTNIHQIYILIHI